MTQRFYLHNATTSLGGTLPGASSLATTPSVTATGASTNRTMSGTVGSSQVSAALTTLAQTTEQTNWFRRFLSPALAARTIGDNELSVTISVGASESNAASDMFENTLFPPLQLGFWRPSTGSLVAWTLSGAAMVNGSNTPNEPGTSQTVCTATARLIAQGITLVDGDAMVIELFSSQSQSMGTAYTNTVFYDGTTEGSTTSIAAYIDVGIDLALQAPAETGQQQIIGGGYMPTYARAFLDRVKRRYWRSGWERRPSGVLVPA